MNTIIQLRRRKRKMKRNVRAEAKEERSIPVQGRVDLVMLADLVKYYEHIGVHVPSMSALLGFAVSTAHMALSSTKQLPVEHETVAEAHSTLGNRKLYQKGMMKRAMKKIDTAMRLENLRFEGEDPRDYVPKQYNMVHNKRTVLSRSDVRNDLGFGGDKARGMLPDIEPSADDIAAGEEVKRKFMSKLGEIKVSGKDYDENGKLRIHQTSISNSVPTTREPITVANKNRLQARKAIEHWKKLGILGKNIASRPHLIQYLTQDEKDSIGEECKIDNHTQPPTTDVPSVEPVVKAKGSNAPLGQSPKQLAEAERRRKERDEKIMGDW
jgi:hypothetical protein